MRIPNKIYSANEGLWVIAMESTSPRPILDCERAQGLEKLQSIVWKHDNRYLGGPQLKASIAVFPGAVVNHRTEGNCIVLLAEANVLISMFHMFILQK